MSGDTFNQVGFAKTPKVVAYVLKTKGIADTLLHSSPDLSVNLVLKKWRCLKLFDAGVELI